jgi:hypothetical protein
MASRKEDRLSEHPGRYSYEIDCQSRTACGDRLARAQVDVVVGLRPRRVDREDHIVRCFGPTDGHKRALGASDCMSSGDLCVDHRLGGPEDVVAADHICR